MDNMEQDSTSGLNKDDNSAARSSGSNLEKVKEILSVRREDPAIHYEGFSLLGSGSFGEVHSTKDILLGRDVAIKSIKARFRNEEAVLDRFLKEARGAAQLEHPNIMPVHEVGVTDELGLYFAMKKIEGETLKDVLERLDAETSLYQKKYTREILLEILLSVCNGISFAHSKGVINRALNPANIMIGDYGEVLILNWGLVKKVGAEDESIRPDPFKMDEFGGEISDLQNYISPEQAAGRIDDIDFRSDIYSLGAILYHILTYVPPFERTPGRTLLEKVTNGYFETPRNRRPKLKIPRALEAICLKAMSRHPLSRYRSVDKFAQDLRKYMGHFEVSAYESPRGVRFWRTCKQTPIKSGVAAAVLAALLLTFVAQRSMLYGSYADSVRKADELLVVANALVVQSTAMFDELEAVSAASELKAKSQKEIDLEQSFQALQSEIEIQYNVALSHYLGVPVPYRGRKEVIEGYTQIMTNRINFALHRNAFPLARQWKEAAELGLRGMGAERSKCAVYFAGVQRQVDGLGSIEITGPENIREVMVWPIINDGARKVQGDALTRGKLPLTFASLDQGSYIITVTRSDGGLVPYPIYIHHGEKKVVELEIPEKIPEDMIYVPKGTFFYGGEASRFYRRGRVLLPAFFIKKYEVSFAEYLEFWKSLDEPRLRHKYKSRVRFHKDDRIFFDAWDSEGTLLDERLALNFPVVGVSLDAAKAFCEWKSIQTGAVIRLPTAEEWEKSARGVDGRKYVWGDGFSIDESFTNTQGNDKKMDLIWAPSGKYPRDSSVYNARDMAGNVREMTVSLVPESDALYQIKGGSCSSPRTFLPCCSTSDTPMGPSDVGFRYLQEISWK